MGNFHKHQHNGCIIYRGRGQTNEKEEMEWRGEREKKKIKVGLADEKQWVEQLSAVFVPM